MILATVKYIFPLVITVSKLTNATFEMLAGKARICSRDAKVTNARPDSV